MGLVFREVGCEDCSSPGDGSLHGDGKCAECYGTGYDDLVECSACGGSGECQTCNGDGYVTEDAELFDLFDDEEEDDE